VVGTEIGGRLIPISQPRNPLELAKRTVMSSHAFLKFFKTPTQQFIPLAFIQWTGREYEKSLYIFAVNTTEKTQSSRRRREGV
jgi:hypothetical protein